MKQKIGLLPNNTINTPVSAVANNYYLLLNACDVFGTFRIHNLSRHHDHLWSSYYYDNH